MIEPKDRSLVVRNLTFGVEDSLVSTVGMISGIAIAGVEASSIILTGFILIFVEAFSMAVGSLLSEGYVQEYKTGQQMSLNGPIKGAVIMFSSYVLAGLVPIAPYFFLDGKIAIAWSVVLSLIALFLLGVTHGKLSGTNIIRNGFLVFLLGGVAILIGIVVGQLVSGLN